MDETKSLEDELLALGAYDPDKAAPHGTVCDGMLYSFDDARLINQRYSEWLATPTIRSFSALAPASVVFIGPCPRRGECWRYARGLMYLSAQDAPHPYYEYRLQASAARVQLTHMRFDENYGCFVRNKMTGK